MTARRVPRTLAALGLALCLGCGGGPKIVAVSGVATHQGKPVPNLFLSFEPEHGRPSWGITDEQGRFRLHYDQHQEGAVVAKHKVTVRFKPRDPGEEEGFSSGKAKMPKGFQAALQKYGPNGSAPLTVEVKPGGEPLELKLD